MASISSHVIVSRSRMCKSFKRDLFASSPPNMTKVVPTRVTDWPPREIYKSNQLKKKIYSDLIMLHINISLLRRSNLAESKVSRGVSFLDSNRNFIRKEQIRILASMQIGFSKQLSKTILLNWLTHFFKEVLHRFERKSKKERHILWYSERGNWRLITT